MIKNYLQQNYFRYVTEVLSDAKLLSSHARKRNMDVEDVRLSASQYDERHVTAPVSRHVLANMSRVKNSVPLPVPANKSGVRLPADRFCTTAVNYRYRVNKKIRPSPNIFTDPVE